ncbi:MAG: type II toxin-antitoxin system VapC family toxin [Ignavibacteria bacterium]|jgi:PIN domain nuclease of toxin-antitoxin system
MKYLIDTNVFLWFIEGSSKLSPKAINIFSDPSNEIYLSIVSLWEIAIKLSINKLWIAEPFSIFIKKYVYENNIEILHLNVEDITQLKDLNFYHKDLFDRTIIAQCIDENLPIITSNKTFMEYPVKVIW